MSPAAHLLLALTCILATAKCQFRNGQSSIQLDPFNPIKRVQDRPTGDDKGTENSDLEGAGEDTIIVKEPPNELPGYGVSALPKPGKPKLTVGDLLQALLLQKTKKDKLPEDAKDEDCDSKIDKNSDKQEDDKSKDVDNNGDKTNNNATIINLNDLQAGGLSFLNALNSKQGFIYVVLPGGQPQLLPLNQPNLQSQKNIPKYVVLIGNGQSNLFGNSGLQFLNGLLADCSNLPNQGISGNVPSGLIPLLNLLPTLGVQGVNVLPSIWNNGKYNPGNTNIPGGPIINVFPNVGSNPFIPNEKPGAGKTPPPPNKGVTITDFINNWINKIPSTPNKTPVTIPSKNDGGQNRNPGVDINWLNILSKLPGFNQNKGPSDGNIDINSFLAVLGNKGLNDGQSKRPDGNGSGGNTHIIITNQDNGSTSQSKKPVVDSSDNDINIILTLIKFLNENGKINVKIPVEEKPTINQGKPAIPDSELIKILIQLIGQNPNVAVENKPNKDIGDGKENISHLIEILLQLLSRKPNIVVIGDKDKKQEQDKEILIQLLGGLSNKWKIDVDKPKVPESDLTHILVQILSQYPGLGSKGRVPISGNNDETVNVDSKIPNIILQLFGLQPPSFKPNVNVGRPTVNWPVTVSGQNFVPGSVGIDPQFLAMLMKTFSQINLSNGFGSPSVGGNVKFNLPQGFGGQTGLVGNNALWNYLLTHLGCVLDEGNSVGFNVIPNSKIVTNVGSNNGLVPLNKWLQYAQMSSNNGPVYNFKK